MEEKKYYTLSKEGESGLSIFYEGRTCYPVGNWIDAEEGIFTDLKLVETWEDKDRKKFGYIEGTMVKTEEPDFDTPLSLQIQDIIVLGESVLLRLKDEKGNRGLRNYWTLINQGELVPVETGSLWGGDGNTEKASEYMEKVLEYYREHYGVSYERAMEICINVFAEKKLDCCDTVTVYGESVFYVSYPGWYRGSCDCFVMTEEGKTKSVGIYSWLQCRKASGWEFRLSDIQEKMAKFGISAGEDSGDKIEGVTEEERKLYTTYRLPSGAVIVQWKAESFNYRLISNERLASKVDKGLGKWLYRLGEKNPFYYWYD